jgi:DNA-directed RNA polymerase subunit RPC12/RpoP
MIPVDGIAEWEKRQRAEATADRHRFEKAVRVAQHHGEAVVCAGCGKALDMRSRGATTSKGGLTRCAPCGFKAVGS